MPSGGCESETIWSADGESLALLALVVRRRLHTSSKSTSSPSTIGTNGHCAAKPSSWQICIPNERTRRRPTSHTSGARARRRSTCPSLVLCRRQRIAGQDQSSTCSMLAVCAAILTRKCLSSKFLLTYSKKPRDCMPRPWHTRTRLGLITRCASRSSKTSQGPILPLQHCWSPLARNCLPQRHRITGAVVASRRRGVIQCFVKEV